MSQENRGDDYIFSPNPLGEFLQFYLICRTLRMKPAPRARWGNTAHKVNFVKIYYPFHPYFEEELKVVRQDKGNIFHVKAPDGTVRGIPIWMTDKDKCSQIKESPFPYCSLNALKDLRELLSCFQKTP